MLQLFCKKFLRIVLYYFLLKLHKMSNRKKKACPLVLTGTNKGGLLFKVPGLIETIFTPYGFLQLRKR